MKLAVIIPTLNEEDAVGPCIESAAAEGEVEIVVVDGGSDDATVERASSGGVLVVTAPRGRGPQLNRGAASCDADRLLFLHADCRLPSGWLSPVNRSLDDERVALTCFRLRTDSSALPDPPVLYRWWLILFDLRSRSTFLPYGDQGMAVRREIFEEVGGFPEIPLMEDVAFANRCRKRGTIRRLPLEITTTARRVEQRPLKTTLMLMLFPTLYRFGVSPDTLARWYGNPR